MDDLDFWNNGLGEMIFEPEDTPPHPAPYGRKRGAKRQPVGFITFPRKGAHSAPSLGDAKSRHSDAVLNMAQLFSRSYQRVTDRASRAAPS